MKRLRSARSLSVVHRKSAKLAVIATTLVAVGVVASAPAVAGPVPNGHSCDAHGRKHNALKCGPSGDDPVVNFQRNALFTCFGAFTGAPTANTANLSATPTTITAEVTVHAAPGTTVFGQLTQSGCTRLKFFTLTVDASGVGTTTVSDLRISNDAFVWFISSAGDFEITPEVEFL